MHIKFWVELGISSFVHTKETSKQNDTNISKTVENTMSHSPS